MTELGLEAYQAWYLVTTYGAQSEEIWKRFGERTEPDTEERLLLAELSFCLDHEMVHTPADFFIRRTGRLYFDIESVRKHLEAAIKYLETELGYSPEQSESYRSALLEEIEDHSAFSPERH